jgi:exonuclease SbcD
MPTESLRFVHAADLHLEQPPHGLTEVPDQLRELLIDAPFQAAARVFETAIVEDVDFVLLSGDVLQPRAAGPHALAFLFEQFQLLRDQRIQVYWAGGQHDGPDQWPTEVPLPDNVHVFPPGELKEFTHRDHEEPVATILGMSASDDGYVRSGDFRTEPTNRFTVAVVHGEVDAEALASHKQIDYWALGGLHQPKTLQQAAPVIQYAGSPQGRCPGETGPHGCTLVQVDHGRKARTKFIVTDVLRWREETLPAEEAGSRNDLQRHLRTRMQRIGAEAGQSTTIVSWRIAADGPAAEGLRRGDLGQELVDWLRTEFGRAKPAVWTASLQVEAPAALSEELYEEDTILGDFLRAVRKYDQDDGLALNWLRFLPGLTERPALANLLQLPDAAERRALLDESALLGLQLLSGGDEAAA